MKIWLVNFVRMLFLGVVFYPSIAMAAHELPPAWPWHGVSINGIDFSPEELESISTKLHLTSVQLRLLPRDLAAKEKIPPSEAWDRSLAWGDAMLDECSKLGIVAIMTVENFPIDPKTPYIHSAPDFWKSERDLNEVVRLASDVGKHYSKRGKELVAYQLLSEPTLVESGSASKPPNWNVFAKRVIKAIRAGDSARWIAVAPPTWGLPNAYEGFKPFSDKRIIYGSHMYFPHEFTHQGILTYKGQYSYPGRIAGKLWDKSALEESMLPLRKFQVRYDVPVWIGEFSAIIWADGGERYIEDLASTFNSYGWSWTYFSLNGYFGWNPEFDGEKPVPMNSWVDHRIGDKSKRWQTLERILNQ